MNPTITGEVDGQRRRLELSNGAYSALHEVLALASSRLARTDWQRMWALWLASRDLNFFPEELADYDVTELPWELADVEAERRFLLGMIGAAQARLGWETLDYRPDYVVAHLAALRELVEACDPPYRLEKTPELPEHFDACPRHGVLEHQGGCIVCNGE